MFINRKEITDTITRAYVSGLALFSYGSFTPVRAVLICDSLALAGRQEPIASVVTSPKLTSQHLSAPDSFVPDI